MRLQGSAAILRFLCAAGPVVALPAVAPLYLTSYSEFITTWHTSLNRINRRTMHLFGISIPDVEAKQVT